MLVFRPGDEIPLKARVRSRVLLLGGAALDGPRHVWWNFVSSSPERIEQAKADWKAGRFAAVPGETGVHPAAGSMTTRSYGSRAGRKATQNRRSVSQGLRRCRVPRTRVTR
jgi:hypothetical protein